MTAPPPSGPPPSYWAQFGDDSKFHQGGNQSQNYPASQPQQGYVPPAVGYQPGVYNNPQGTTAAVNANTALGTENTRSWDFDNIGNISSFSDKAVRRAFIRKVYLILTAQLLVTAAFVCMFMFIEELKFWVQTHSWFYYVSYGVFLATLITLVCCPGFRRNYPWNFICLLVFTLAFSYMAGTISSYYKTDSVLIAAGITAAVCLAISIFAIQTKIDFTMCSGLIFALCMVVLLFGLSIFIVYLTVELTAFQAKVLQCTYGALAALLFSLFLVYDTQMVIGGHKHELSPEEYVYASLQLYLDVVYIFLIILACFGTSD